MRESTKGQDDLPSELKQTIFERAVTEYSSYLLGNLREHFTSHEYLDGLALEKKDALARMAKTMSRSTVFAVLLISYVSGIHFDIKILGNEIFQFPAVIEVLTFLLAASLLQSVLLSIDYMLIDRMLETLCQEVFKIQSPRYTYAHRNAQGIFIDMLTPWGVGYASTRSHWAVVLCMGVFFIGYYLGALVFHIVTIGYAAHYILVNGHATSEVFTIATWLSLVFMAASLFLLIMTFAIKLRFVASHTDLQNEM